jgi:hypothetical protein
MKNSASMQFHVNKTAPISLYTDGLEILFRNPSRIPADTDSGTRARSHFDCLKPGQCRSGNKGPM